jgi:hypothetical protein
VKFWPRFSLELTQGAAIAGGASAHRSPPEDDHLRHRARAALETPSSLRRGRARDDRPDFLLRYAHEPRGDLHLLRDVIAQALRCDDRFFESRGIAANANRPPAIAMQAAAINARIDQLRASLEGRSREVDSRMEHLSGFVERIQRELSTKLDQLQARLKAVEIQAAAAAVSVPWFMPKDEPRLSSELRVCLGL